MTGWGGRSRSTKALHCRQIVGLSSTASAFVGLGISPLTTASMNEFDLISDPHRRGQEVRSSETLHVKGCLSRT